MWQQLLKVHLKTYGDLDYFLSSDYKNIGTCQLALNQTEDAIESFLKGVMYSQSAMETGNLSET